MNNRRVLVTVEEMSYAWGTGGAPSGGASDQGLCGPALHNIYYGLVSQALTRAFESRAGVAGRLATLCGQTTPLVAKQHRDA